MNTYYGSFQKVPLAKPVSIMDIARFADRFGIITAEDVENIVNVENPYGAIVQFGGQTAIKLTKALSDMGVKILGTQEVDMDRAEDRKEFDEALSNCGILLAG